METQEEWTREHALWALGNKTVVLGGAGFCHPGILTKIEACNWNTLLYLKSQNIDQLKTMKGNMSIEELLVRMQHGRENITINI